MDKMSSQLISEYMFRTMWDNLSKSVNHLVKFKMGPVERKIFLESLPDIIEGLEADGHPEEAMWIRKKLANFNKVLMKIYKVSADPAATDSAADRDKPIGYPVKFAEYQVNNPAEEKA